MPRDLAAAAQSVTDEASFVAFLRLMPADWHDEARGEAEAPSRPYSPGANGWANGTIGQFIDAAASWADDTSTRTAPTSTAAEAWRRAAMIVLMAAFYE